MATTNNIIHVENLGKSFGSLEVIKEISFDVNKGDVLGIIGPSGSGKSTLLRCITQLETVNKGSISICGNPMLLMVFTVIKKRCARLGSRLVLFSRILICFLILVFCRILLRHRGLC